MLNIIYAGTPDVAVPPLDYLANSDKVRVVGVLTREHCAATGCGAGKAGAA